MRICLTVLMVSLMVLSTAYADDPEAKLEWTAKAYGDGKHNAFTDIARWKGAYYLCFRNGLSHGSTDGEIRIMRSDDFRHWTHVETIRTLADDRDPHFCATPKRLFVYFGVWSLCHTEDDKPPQRDAVRSCVSWTDNGTDWASPKAFYEPRWWTWRVIENEGTFYGAAYTAYRPTPPGRELRLLTSQNGIDWEFRTTMATERGPSESDMWFDEAGHMHIVTRMTDETNIAFHYESGPALDTWSATPLGAIIHSPAVARWNGRVFVAGRSKGKGGWVTRFWELDGGQAEELLTLPSGGDTSYPGLMPDPDAPADGPPTLLISWYSQHAREEEPNATRNTASVYVGKITVGK